MAQSRVQRPDPNRQCFQNIDQQHPGTDNARQLALPPGFRTSDLLVEEDNGVRWVKPCVAPLGADEKLSRTTRRLVWNLDQCGHGVHLLKVQICRNNLNALCWAENLAGAVAHPDITCTDNLRQGC
jgi:hypothetical protein